VCNTVGLGAKASLDFGRLCRIVQLAREEEWDPANLLEVADARTLTRLLRDGGLTEAHRTRRAPVMEAFLVGQRLVTGPANLRAVRCHLRAVATTAAPREVLRAALAPTPADRLAS